MQINIKTCLSCRYFDPEYELCRVNPPIILNVKDNELDKVRLSFWPAVNPKEDYCGKWVDASLHAPSDPFMWKSQI